MKMPKALKSVLKILGMLIGAVLVFAICFIGYLTVTEYRPQPSESVKIEGTADKVPVLGEKILVLSYNIGYANLDRESDFFMDGGKNVRNGDKGLVLNNLEGIIEGIERADADIMFLQEVDENSTRSFKTLQATSLGGSFYGNYAHALNYKCDFVPFPWPPIGKVNSGIMTHSAYTISNAERISLPCPFSWPVSAANLKRCLLISRFDIEGTDKQLVAVNLHLEAYDDGEGQIAQTKMLWDILEAEYANGNYVIAGGDFNQTFPGSLDKYPIKNPELWTPGVLFEEDLPKGWQYVYDDTTPTCRLLDAPYDPETTQHYVIDGFIISPNVELIGVETADFGFQYSDHNPVAMCVVLK